MIPCEGGVVFILVKQINIKLSAVSLHAFNFNVFTVLGFGFAPDYY